MRKLLLVAALAGSLFGTTVISTPLFLGNIHLKEACVNGITYYWDKSAYSGMITPKIINTDGNFTYQKCN